MPGAPLSPTKTGVIDLAIPDWYNIDQGSKQAYMFSDNQADMCSSDQITISSAGFSVGNLRILFEDVKEGYLSG